MADLWRAKGEQLFDNSGNPLNGGKFYFYDAGTSSARTVYQDDGAATPWTQPIELDANGRLTASIYIPTGDFKEKLTTSADVEIYTEDNIPGAVTIPSSTYAQPDIPVISKTTDYTITADDRGKLIKTDTTSGNVQLTLPSAVSAGDGFVVFVQHVVGANATTVVRAGADTLNGGSSVRLSRQWSSLMIDGDGGTAWTAMSADFLFTTPAAKTTTYAVTLADVGKTIPADATGGAFDVDLPAAAIAGDGFEITVIKIDSSANAVTLDPDGAELVNGEAGFALSGQWRWARVRSDGTAWYVLTPLDASETAKGIGEWATAAEFRANTADRELVTNRVWSASAEVTLTDATTIAVDMSTFINAVVTLTDNRTLGQPSNTKVGQSGCIRIIQDAGGTNTLAYHADWKFAGGVDPVLSTAGNAQDLLFYQVVAENVIFASLVKAIG